MELWVVKSTPVDKMPLYFVTPTEDPTLAITSLAEKVSRLDGIMCTLRRDCLETAVEIYREIPTRAVACPTDLLQEFQKGTEREDASDLELDFPEFDPPFGQDEHAVIGGPHETVELFENRINAGMKIAQRMGKTVLVVAPSSVIQQWTGVTLKPGEMYEYSDELSYYARCLLELKEWRETTSS